VEGKVKENTLINERFMEIAVIQSYIEEEDVAMRALASSL
jgi:hypothetical protein